MVNLLVFNRPYLTLVTSILSENNYELVNRRFEKQPW